MKKLTLFLLVVFNLGSVGGCKMGKITDYRHLELEPFWTSYSLEDERFEPYIVNGALVSLYLPQGGNKDYDTAVTLVSPSSGASCEILELSIQGFGPVTLASSDLIKADKPVDGHRLFRADKVIARKIDASKLEPLAAANGEKIEASLLVRVSRGGQSVEQRIAFSFAQKVREYLPMR